jgi:hypothetical protein
MQYQELRYWLALMDDLKLVLHYAPHYARKIACNDYGTRQLEKVSKKKAHSIFLPKCGAPTSMALF